MAEDRDRPPGGAERPGSAAPPVDPGDAVPPGVGAGAGGDEGETARGGASRDPGDAVPPGVAPSEPPEPTEEDRRVLEKLRDLPRRG